METKFKEAEKRERKAIQWFVSQNPECKDLEINPIGDFSSDDFTMWSGNTHITGEIKIRTFEWDKYPTVVIELDKLNRLTEKNEENFRLYNGKLYYFAFYPKSRNLLIFDMMNTPMTITYEWCPVTTMADKGSKWKAMVNYKLEDAIMNIKY